jgi:hypothetical protein
MLWEISQHIITPFESDFHFFQCSISLASLKRKHHLSLNTPIFQPNQKNWPGLTRVWPGGLGPGSTLRVDRVSPGQFPSGFFPSPGPVPSPGRPGPGSTRRAGPGFKTLPKSPFCFCFSLIDLLFPSQPKAELPFIIFLLSQHISPLSASSLFSFLFPCT